MDKGWDIIILGAGASGCMAAITAARQGARVLLLEQKDCIGKKIPATGNGKCNFTNANLSDRAFYGNAQLAQTVLARFGLEETLSFFHEIGILPLCKNGYYYPNSKTASSVRLALEEELSHSGVQVRTNIHIQKINILPVPTSGSFVENTPDLSVENASSLSVQNTSALSRKNTGSDDTENRFQLETDGEVFYTHKLILATGLLAAPKLGSNGSAFPLIKDLGHHFTRLAPALCGFSAKGMNFRKIAGVRTDARITLYIDGIETASDEGELQLTDYGVSGIPVFQISRHASLALQEKRNVTLSVNFLPHLPQEEACEEISRRFSISERRVLPQMYGLLNEKLLPVLLSLAGISGTDLTESIPSHKIEKFIQICTNCTITLTKPRDYEFAQVCAGGICSEEVDPDTLESRLHSGLYFAGELLDVDGICGGYNLQWAWSSGYVAGCAAASALSPL